MTACTAYALCCPPSLLGVHTDSSSLINASGQATLTLTLTLVMFTDQNVLGIKTFLKEAVKDFRSCKLQVAGRNT